MTMPAARNEMNEIASLAARRIMASLDIHSEIDTLDAKRHVLEAMVKTLELGQRYLKGEHLEQSR
jgi:hypothetical protein